MLQSMGSQSQTQLGNGTELRKRYLLPRHKKETMPFAGTWVDLEMIILSEVSQKKINIAYMWNLTKMMQMNLYKK